VAAYVMFATQTLSALWPSGFPFHWILAGRPSDSGEWFLFSYHAHAAPASLAWRISLSTVYSYSESRGALNSAWTLGSVGLPAPSMVRDLGGRGGILGSSSRRPGFSGVVAAAQRP